MLVLSLRIDDQLLLSTRDGEATLTLVGINGQDNWYQIRFPDGNEVTCGVSCSSYAAVSVYGRKVLIEPVEVRPSRNRVGFSASRDVAIERVQPTNPSVA